MLQFGIFIWHAVYSVVYSLNQISHDETSAHEIDEQKHKYSIIKEVLRRLCIYIGKHDKCCLQNLQSTLRSCAPNCAAFCIGGVQKPSHDDVIKWKHFPRHWRFVRGIHRSPVNSPHKGQWRGALMFSLISIWINGWVNNREAVDSRRYRAHYDVTVMGDIKAVCPKLFGFLHWWSTKTIG